MRAALVQCYVCHFKSINGVHVKWITATHKPGGGRFAQGVTSGSCYKIMFRKIHTHIHNHIHIPFRARKGWRIDWNMLSTHTLEYMRQILNKIHTSENAQLRLYKHSYKLYIAYFRTNILMVNRLVRNSILQRTWYLMNTCSYVIHSSRAVQGGIYKKICQIPRGSIVGLHNIQYNSARNFRFV